MITPLLSNYRLIEQYLSLPNTKGRFRINREYFQNEKCYIPKKMAISYTAERYDDLYQLIWWCVNFNLLIKTVHALKSQLYVYLHNYLRWQYYKETHKDMDYTLIYRFSTKKIIDFDELYCTDEFKNYFNNRSTGKLDEYANQLVEAFREIDENAVMGNLKYKEFLNSIVDSCSFRDEFAEDTNLLSSKYYTTIKQKVNSLVENS